VLAGDHVYKMDYRRILAFHQDHRGVATVATLRVPVAEAAGQFGVVQVDAASRVVGFQEKPECPASIPGDSGFCLASMGIYVFNARFLIDELRRDSQANVPGRDFGHHTLPMVIGRGDVYAFAFSGAGTSAPAYWQDVGTLDSYYRANMDLLTDVHGLNLYDRAWPIYSFQPSFPPPLVAVVSEPAARIVGGPGRNIFANGTMADGWLRASVVGFDCRIESGAIVEDSILFDSVVIGPGAHVHRAILDKRVRIGPGVRIGLDPAQDLERGFVISPQGITCVPKGAVVDAC
jgi:glucose-1-phosphate adenylyltransferase